MVSKGPRLRGNASPFFLCGPITAVLNALALMLQDARLGIHIIHMRLHESDDKKYLHIDGEEIFFLVSGHNSNSLIVSLARLLM